MKLSGARTTLIIMWVFGGALLLGAAVAPHIFNLLLSAARSAEGLQGMRDIMFEKVAGRCVLISILLVVIPALKFSGLTTLKSVGFQKGVHGTRQVLLWWGIGMFSMVVFLGIGLAIGAYEPQLDQVDMGIVGKILSYLAGAVIVGYVEEFFFRGAVYGILRKGTRLIPAAAIASVLFAVVHFAAPDPPVGVVYGRWYSGFRMLPHMISPVDMRWSNGFMFLTLFTMGVTLCLLYEYYGNLYAAIGLHAGWVWLMRVGGYFIERDRSSGWLVLYGPSMTVAKSAMALILVSLFLAMAVILHIRRCRQRT